MRRAHVEAGGRQENKENRCGYYQGNVVAFGKTKGVRRGQEGLDYVRWNQRLDYLMV